MGSEFPPKRESIAQGCGGIGFRTRQLKGEVSTRDLRVEIRGEPGHGRLNCRSRTLALRFGYFLDPTDLHETYGGKDGSQDQKEPNPARYRLPPNASNGFRHEGLTGTAPSSMDAVAAQTAGHGRALTKSLRRNMRSLTTMQRAAWSKIA